LRSIPGKLQDLYEINKILAHRPWLLNKSHIEVSAWNLRFAPNNKIYAIFVNVDDATRALAFPEID